MRRCVRLMLLLALVSVMPLAARAQESSPTPIIVVPATAEPTVTPVPAPVDEGIPVLVSARSDLELLANSQLEAERPVGWSGSLNISDPQLALLARLDLELLASNLLGVDVRPAGWFGAVNSTSFAIARDVRHDLELLADAVVEPGVRPPGWSGSDPMMRCSRATQSLIGLLERQGFVLQADPNSAAFCAQAELQASRHVEQTILAAPVVVMDAAPANPVSTLTGTIQAGYTGAAVFLDRSASQPAGSLPRDIVFTPVARSGAQFSNMMLVRGEGFEVFIDYSYTTIALSQFETLPTIDTIFASPACAAEWCG